MTLSKGGLAGIIVSAVVVACVAVFLGVYYGVYVPKHKDKTDNTCNGDRCTAQVWSPPVVGCDKESGQAVCLNDSVGDWKCAEGYWNLLDLDNVWQSGPYYLKPSGDQNTWTLSLVNKAGTYRKAIKPAGGSKEEPKLLFPDVATAENPQILNGSLYEYNSSTDKVSLLESLAGVLLKPVYPSFVTGCLNSELMCDDCGPKTVIVDDQKQHQIPLTYKISTNSFDGQLVQNYRRGFIGAANGNQNWVLLDKNNNWVSGPYSIDDAGGYLNYKLTYNGDSTDTYILLDYNAYGDKTPVKFQVRSADYAIFQGDKFGIYKNNGKTLCKSLDGIYALPDAINTNLQFWENDTIGNWNLMREDVYEKTVTPTGDPIILDC